MGRWFVMPIIFSLVAWASIATNVVAQGLPVQTITNRGNTVNVRAIKTPDDRLLPGKSFGGQNGRSIECPIDGAVHEILNLDLANEVGEQFAIMLYPPPPHLPGGAGAHIMAILDFSDGGVAFSPTRTATFVSGIIVDWKNGAVISVPAGRIRVSAYIIVATGAIVPGQTIHLAASLSKGPQARTFPLTATQKFWAVPPGAFVALAIPGFASQLKVETSNFATRSFRIQIINMTGAVTLERDIAPGQVMEPITLPIDAWTWQLTNLGLANIGSFNAIWELSF